MAGAVIVDKWQMRRFLAERGGVQQVVWQQWVGSYLGAQMRRFGAIVDKWAC